MELEMAGLHPAGDDESRTSPSREGPPPWRTFSRPASRPAPPSRRLPAALAAR
jgi:hypothetical protein